LADRKLAGSNRDHPPHRPEKLHGDKLKIIAPCDTDGNNTKRYTDLPLKVGGPEAAGTNAGGIHRHMSRGNRVICMPETGERKDIPRVRIERNMERAV